MMVTTETHKWRGVENKRLQNIQPYMDHPYPTISSRLVIIQRGTGETVRNRGGERFRKAASSGHTGPAAQVNVK
ncbi:hypothetical protein ACRRTK_017223 [Alexandromys fortis]